MEQTKGPKPPSPTAGEFKPHMEVGNADNARKMFVSATMSMSWQLAVVVLVPVIGGFKLDEHFDTSPLWTIIGFVLAAGGMGSVLWRQLQIHDPATAKKKVKH